MSIDFLICRHDASIIVAIELDDKSHLKAEAKQRDEKKNKALESAGINLIRYTSIPDVDTLKFDVEQYVNI